MAGHPRSRRVRPSRGALGVLCLAGGLGACGAVTGVKGLLLGESGSGAERHLDGFIGGVAADEPQAALVGREILRRGGNAADAAAALGLALAVTLPSRASLDGGGACLAFTPAHGGVVIADTFLPEAPPVVAPTADRPASLPMLATGLYALQDRLGSVRWDELVQPAIDVARRGFPVSVLLANDLAAVAAPLAADAPARAIFSAVDGTPLVADDTLIERDLAASLQTVATLGASAFRHGPLAARFASAAETAGGGLTPADLEAGRASLSVPLTTTDGSLVVAFTPLPETGGIAALRAFELLHRDPHEAGAAEALAASIAAYARSSGAEASALMTASPPPGSLPPLPASTSFAVIDRHGGAVACALTMDNLFGTGRVAPGTGIVLAASPATHPVPLLPSAIAYDPKEDTFRAVVAASGQNDAAAAVAEAMANTLRTGKPIPKDVTEEGRVNVIGCPDGLPGNSTTCGGATDDRGNGLALGNT